MGWGADAWPEGQPNCAVTGNWSDPEGRDRMGVTTGEMWNQTMYQVLYNNSGTPFNGSGSLGDGRTAAVRVMSGNESLQVTIVCQNNVLWVMQTPLHNSTRMIRVFTLSRVLPPIPPPLPVQQDATSPPRDAPQFVLVNITLPRSGNNDASYPRDDLAQTVKPRSPNERK